MGSISDRDTLSSLRYKVQTCFADHAASCPMDTRSYFPGGKMAEAWSWPVIISCRSLKFSEPYFGIRYAVKARCFGKGTTLFWHLASKIRPAVNRNLILRRLHFWQYCVRQAFYSSGRRGYLPLHLFLKFIESARKITSTPRIATHSCHSA
jgi:hypothetical protein